MGKSKILLSKFIFKESEKIELSFKETESLIEHGSVEIPEITKHVKQEICEIPGCTNKCAKRRKKCDKHIRTQQQSRKCNVEGCEQMAENSRFKCRKHRNDK
jgi:hypothetical protein